MNITITRQSLLELWNNLSTLSDLKGFRLGYAIARTKAKLKHEIEVLEESIKPDTSYQEYDAKRIELCRRFAKKDDKGESILQDNQFVFGDNYGGFNEELLLLQDEFAKAIENRRQQIESFNDLMKEEITIEVHEITEADIPTDPAPTVRQVEVLCYLIAES